MFTYIDFSDVLGGTTVACDRLPAQPAVYAFFRNIKLPALAAADHFLAALTATIEAPAAPDRTTRAGPLHKVTLECRSELSQRKSEKLTALVELAPFRVFLGKILATAGLLQSPLYVGKAASLQSRVRQHLDPMSDLAVRLRNAGITITSCTLAYAIVDTCPVPLDDQSMFLIEEIISRLCRPGFVSRIG